MKTIQTELQKIADAIKGTESEESVKTTQDLLAEIRDNIAGTTPSGEVKNMQVLLGEIAQAISDNPPSPAPSETFAVTMTLTLNPESAIADKTYSEIMTAINAGSKVTFTIIVDGESVAPSGYYIFIDSNDASNKTIMVPWYSTFEREKFCTVFIAMNSNNVIWAIPMEEQL